MAMIQIFHITHYRNLPSIITQGGLLCDRTAQALRSVQIGHQHIKDRRLNRVVPIRPGGCVGDYVPFYFAPRSPMLFAISKGAIEEYAGGQSEVVHLVSSVESVDAANVDSVFTDGHADMPPLTSFYKNRKDLAKVDWELMKSKYWHDTDEHPDRCRRRQAEFLVHRFFPWSLISQIAVQNGSILENIREILRDVIHKPEIIIEGSWYY